MLSIFTTAKDRVINSLVLTGETTYGFAIESIFPLINRFSSQRKLQNRAFYERLRKDLLDGCVMPPITLAYVDPSPPPAEDKVGVEEYANRNITAGYVLDGLQRLNTLYSIKDHEKFDPQAKLFFNLIISPKKDMLLYRMITLNNGQRPMSPRHQIEILTEELFDFSEVEFDVRSEKDRGERIQRGAFNLSDISKGYLAFFSGSVHIENNKIISEKMDEIIVGKIMESAVIKQKLEFEKVLQLIDRFVENESARAWLLNQNNLLGFCVGIRTSYEVLSNLSADDFGIIAKNFEEAFKGINVTKVNLGRYRRDLAQVYIAEIGHLRDFSELELLSYFSERIAQ
jgi:hypothetical protein